MELTVDKKNALKAWNEANPKGKKLLENLYGKCTFENQKVQDRVKTFEDALEETGRPNVPDFSMLPDDLVEYFESVYKAVVLVEALNEGKKVDVYNSNKYRYYPYFYHNGSASSVAFCDSSCVGTAAFAGSGSRLSFVSRELSDYAGKTFKNIFQNLITK